jgi:hypothetical protein
MCDYSMACVSTRAAVEGERLVIHRFPNGVKGFVSQPELTAFTGGQTSLWKRISDWLFFRTPTAICLQPGSKLIVRDLPEGGSDQEVDFVQSAAADIFHDAIRCRDGREIPVQRLRVGQVADVLSLAPLKTPEFETETLSNSPS